MAAPRPGTIEFMLSPNLESEHKPKAATTAITQLDMLANAAEYHSLESDKQLELRTKMFSSTTTTRTVQSTYPTPETPTLQSPTTKEQEQQTAERMVVDPVLFSPVEHPVRNVREAMSPLFPEQSQSTPGRGFGERPAHTPMRTMLPAVSTEYVPGFYAPRPALVHKTEAEMRMDFKQEIQKPIMWRVGDSYRRNPFSFLRQIRDETRECIGAGQRRPPPTPSPEPRQSRSSHPQYAGIKKQRSKAKKVAPPPLDTKKTTPARPRKSRPAAQPLHAIAPTDLITPPTSARRLPTAKPRRDSPMARDSPKAKDNKPKDMDWRAVEDVCPPTTNLSHPPYDAPKYRQVAWPGKNAKDLTADPDRMHMHPTELAWATTLQISCATYLTCKRRIFVAKRDALREERRTGKARPFSKTHAQSATRVDVNKASKLWELFNNVGWFDKENFEI